MWHPTGTTVESPTPSTNPAHDRVFGLRHEGLSWFLMVT